MSIQGASRTHTQLGWCLVEQEGTEGVHVEVYLLYDALGVGARSYLL